MNKTLLCSALVSALVLQPQARAAEPAATYTVTGKLAIVSDYRFRGLSQTFGEGFDPGPAIQGGSFPMRAVSISATGLSLRRQYPNGSALEWFQRVQAHDGDFTFDLGTIYYYYPELRVHGTRDCHGRDVQRHDQGMGGVRWRDVEMVRREVLLRAHRLLRLQRRRRRGSV